MSVLESLFDWLLATTLRASALAVVIMGLQLLVRRWLPPQWRYALWMPLVLVLVLPVVPTVPFGILPRKAPAVEASVPEVAAVSGAALIAGVDQPLGEVAPTTMTVNSWALVWLAGSAAVFVFGMAGYRRNMRRITKGAVAVDEALLASVEEAAREVGLGRLPRVVVSAEVESPAVTGLLRPVLLLPADFLQSFSEAEARLILLHELTHVKRLDLPVNGLCCILQALHWFNPILWFAFARMRADRETACDAQVLSLGGRDRRSVYGNALLKLQAVAPRSGLQLGFVGIFESSSELKTRIRDISRHRASHPAWKAGGVTMIGLLTLFGATKAEEPKRTEAPVAPPAAAEEPKVDPTTDIIFKKLQTTVIPVVKFENTSLEEAIDFVRAKSVELDPEKKGVNFVIRKPREESGTADPGKSRVTLDQKSASMLTVLQEMAKQTQLRFSISESGVTFLPINHQDNFQFMPRPEPEKPKGRAAEAGSKIILPSVEFVDVSLTEAVVSLNKMAKENAKGGEVFPVVLDPKVDGTARVQELRLRNVPLTIALKYLGDTTKTVVNSDDKELRITKP
ncbi:M56 family metallopeptidase [Luteolibacter sp. GHJ8]|uniref:M56 family metallopeptidase n=1 Tax=Luteolibacter rhizosphaerae TaxID=2989719 RepID=A0ABT3G4R8_9BACT|nr:M56 family metallopeptidase [Luteolibacter rhizosphaerae]MCW1914862.1 M56 family metallopeptidase [Luteolibacter rhizosphaerae]